MLLVLLLGGQRWRHQESQYSAACFRDENGRQRRIATKVTNSEKALEIAKEFERVVKTGGHLRKVKKVWTSYTKSFRAGGLTLDPQVTAGFPYDSRARGTPRIAQAYWKRLCRARRPASSAPHRLLCLRYLS